MFRGLRGSFEKILDFVNTAIVELFEVKSSEVGDQPIEEEIEENIEEAEDTAEEDFAEWEREFDQYNELAEERFEEDTGEGDEEAIFQQRLEAYDLEHETGIDFMSPWEFDDALLRKVRFATSDEAMEFLEEAGIAHFSEVVFIEDEDLFSLAIFDSPGVTQ